MRTVMRFLLLMAVITAGCSDNRRNELSRRQAERMLSHFVDEQQMRHPASNVIMSVHNANDRAFFHVLLREHYADFQWENRQLFDDLAVRWRTMDVPSNFRLLQKADGFINLRPEYLGNIPIWLGLHVCQIQGVGEVTGIMHVSDAQATVEWDATSSLTSLGTLFVSEHSQGGEIREQCIRHIPHITEFTRYDDGWRITQTRPR